MAEGMSWFEVIEHKSYLYVIRERLYKLEPRFYTKYINLYLLIGNKKALLIDTGTGLFPLKPMVQKLIEDKELIVVNTHGHFDHRGGNEEFEAIMAHASEIRQLSKPFDISFLKKSSQEIVKNYDKKNFTLQPAKITKSIKNGSVIDLGDISLKIIHTPGHSPGSISLLTNNNELFTGDTAHYGTMYLPKRKKFPVFLSSLRKLLDICESYEEIELYPSHENFPVGKELLESLITGISNLDAIWNSKERDEFLEGWILEDEHFKYVIE